MLNTNEARIETCTFCNYSCVFCLQNTRRFKRKKEIMSLEDYKYILLKLKNEAPHITDITISGFGEAFLDNTLMRKIEFTKDNKFDVHIVTNGSFLSDGIIDELIELNIADIRISLHSINSNNYRKLTNANRGLHAQVMRSIEYIIRNKNTTRLIITVECVDINKDEIRDIIKYYNDRIDLLEIWTPHNWVDAFKYREGDIIRETCGRPISSPLQIQVNGTINMCCFDYNGLLLLGDFKTQTLKEIFSIDPYRSLKIAHDSGNFEGTNFICRNCDQRKNQTNAIIYNSKYSVADRLFRTSTNYSKVL